MKLSYDLHIHSCLSPCGDEDSTPANIVGMAAVKGLDVIAITDHNSCGNCRAAAKVAKENGVLFIPGMEITTAEEVHVLALFPDVDKAEAFSEHIHNILMPVKNDEKAFGKQQFVDENDIIMGSEPLLLINATTLTFDEAYDEIAEYGGIMIPAHIDKSSTSVLSNMGFIPPDSRFLCAEIKHTGFAKRLKEAHPYLQKCNIINNSDAHYLEDINEPENFIEADEKTALGVLAALVKSPSGEIV
ncbi:MAG: PHP domain-containing protein [Ruminococcus sp.]|jgi:PHP family Zn ribbon phosphoesterase|nr:PHP domain-containing protein [Ruminococcus sp.]